MFENIKFVLYSPRQNAFHVEDIEEVPNNAIETVKYYLQSEDKENYRGADYMLIGICTEDKINNIINAFIDATGIQREKF